MWLYFLDTLSSFQYPPMILYPASIPRLGIAAWSFLGYSQPQNHSLKMHCPFFLLVQINNKDKDSPPQNPFILIIPGPPMPPFPLSESLHQLSLLQPPLFTCVSLALQV